MTTEQRLDRLELSMIQFLTKLDHHTAQKEYQSAQLEIIIAVLNKQNETFEFMQREFSRLKDEQLKIKFKQLEVKTGANTHFADVDDKLDLIQRSVISQQERRAY